MGADGVPSDVAESGLPMRILDAGADTGLPNVAADALRGVAVRGILAVQVHHEKRDGIGPVADGDEVKVIGHYGVCGDPNLALFAERAD